MSYLAPRQLACLRLAADGHTGREIAALTGIPYDTVRNHLRTVAEKLGARNTTNAVHLAHQLGLLGDDRRTAA